MYMTKSIDIVNKNIPSVKTRPNQKYQKLLYTYNYVKKSD